MKKVLVILALAVAVPSAYAATRSLHVNSGSTKFLAIGRPSLLKIRGEGKGPVGELKVDEKNTVSGELEVDMSSFKTGIDMRDTHMKEKYLEVEKYPKAVLKLSGFSMPPADQLPKEVAFEGSMTLHGETQPVKDGKVQLTRNGDKIGFVAKFQMVITSYKIAIPSYGGIKVAENVEVEVQSEAAGPSGSVAATR
jgi:polyisoprenoid-binding protein YceI